MLIATAPRLSSLKFINATFLCHAYPLALRYMNKWTWHKCCQEACNDLNCLGMMDGACYKAAGCQLAHNVLTVSVLPTPKSVCPVCIQAPPGAKPIMINGQDESRFAQYLMGSKMWVGPKGIRPLLPKSEGDGYMAALCFCVM